MAVWTSLKEIKSWPEIKTTLVPSEVFIILVVQNKNKIGYNCMYGDLWLSVLDVGWVAIACAR